jgi:hypothetical protein
MATDIYMGKRLSFDAQSCTVRYQGQVRGTKGEWLGVEWDDPTRGKHSGEHLGTRYFTCLNPSPTSASFIRPTRKSDIPRTFVQALKSKYASEEDEHFEDPDVEVVFNHQPPSKTPTVQFKPILFNGKLAEEIGFDKIRAQLAQLSELKIIILDGLCIHRPEVRGTRWVEEAEKTDVREACPKAVELDLSRNLFEEWREIAGICEQLGELKSLRVE